MSKLTTKAQTTLPKRVRIALQLCPGDKLAYKIEGQRVMLSKARESYADDPLRTFHEWDSEVDRRAYAKL